MAYSDLIKALTENKTSINNKEVYIWGTGNTSKLYIEGLNRIQNELKIKGYIDNNVTCKTFNNLPVYKPDEVIFNDSICILICTPQPNVIREISNYLNDKNVEYHLLDEIILKLHKDDVLAVYNSLCDEQSKNVYEEIVESRIKGTYPSASVVSDDQYFCFDRFSKGIQDEVFVDCGAYIGDSIEDFLKCRNGNFKKIISFEPDKNNFEKLKDSICRLSKEYNFDKSLIDCINCGVSNSSGLYGLDTYEENKGLGSKLLPSSDATDSCKIVSLDDFIKEDFSFLKADIESFEYKMLLGAEKSIKKYKPALAICIYHNVVDLYSVPLLIKSFIPEYKFFIRHHTEFYQIQCYTLILINKG